MAERRLGRRDARPGKRILGHPGRFLGDPAITLASRVVYVGPKNLSENLILPVDSCRYIRILILDRQGKVKSGKQDKERENDDDLLRRVP